MRRVSFFAVVVCCVLFGRSSVGQTPKIFLGDEASEKLLRSSVRVNVNPHAVHFGSGVMIDVDREKHPRLMEPDEVAVLTAAHVANGLDWQREIEIQIVDLSGAKGSRSLRFGQSFPARLVMLADDDENDLAVLAAKIPKQLFEKGEVRLAKIPSTPYGFRLDETLQIVGFPEGALPDLKGAFPGQRSSIGKLESVYISESRVEGHSGGPAFSADGTVVAVCSGKHYTPTAIALGFGLVGEAADLALKAGKNESRMWSLFVPLDSLDALLTKAESQTDALVKLEKAVKEYKELRKKGH